MRVDQSGNDGVLASIPCAGEEDVLRANGKQRLDIPVIPSLTWG